MSMIETAMKEILLYPSTAEERDNARAARTLLVDARVTWRESLYLLLFDGSNGAAGPLFRVEAIAYPDGEEADSHAPLLEVKLGEPFEIPGLAVDPQDPPPFTAFDRALAAAKAGAPLTAERRVSRKEADLLARSYIEQGVGLTLAGKFAEARELFGQALELEPENHLVYFYLANISLDTGRFDLGLYYYAQVFRRAADFQPAWDYCGMAWSQKGRLERAIAHWDKSLELNPEGEFARVNRAKARIQLKQFEEARLDLEAAAARAPGNVYLLNLLGVVNANLDRLDEAVACWRKVIEAGKDDEYLHLNLARALTEKGDFSEALKEYRKLLELFPEEHEMRQAIEKTVKRVQEAEAAARGARPPDDAEEGLEERVARVEAPLDPTLALVAPARSLDLDAFVGYFAEFGLRAKGIARVVIDPGVEAEVSFDPSERKLTIGGRAARTTRSLRAALRQTGKELPDLEDQEEIRLRTVSLGEPEPNDPARVAQGIEEARKAIQANPDDEWAHYSLGTLLAQRGDFEAAAASFARVAELDPNNAIALYALGLALVRLERLDEALEALQRAIISTPDAKLQMIAEEWNFKESIVYFALGDVLIRMGRFREAAEAFKKGLAVDAASALAHFQLGTCQGVLEDFPAAVESLTNAIQLNPTFAYAYSKLGIVYFKTNLYREAFAMLQKAVQAEGNDSETFYYLGEVADRLGKTAEARAAWNRAMEVAPPEDIYHRKAQDRLLGRQRKGIARPAKQPAKADRPAGEKPPRPPRPRKPVPEEPEAPAKG